MSRAAVWRGRADLWLLEVACLVHLAVAVVVRTSRPLGQGFERSRQCYDSAARNDLSGKHQGCEESGLGLSVGYLGRFLRVRSDGGYMMSKTAICSICVFGRTQTSSRLWEQVGFCTIGLHSSRRLGAVS